MHVRRVDCKVLIFRVTYFVRSGACSMENGRLGAHYDLVNRDFLTLATECEISEFPFLPRPAQKYVSFSLHSFASRALL